MVTDSQQELCAGHMKSRRYVGFYIPKRREIFFERTIEMF